MSSKTTDDAYERAEGPRIETHGNSYFARHDLGDVVYLSIGGQAATIDDRPLRGVIVGITIRPDSVLYAVRWSNGVEEGHYGIELMDDPEL